jgi:hypothetical protein
VADHHIRLLALEPANELVAVLTLDHQRRHRTDIGVVFLKGPEGSAPAELQTLVLMLVENDPGLR